MLKLTVRGMFSHKLRSILTAIAIILGTGMICGTFIITNQITQAFNQIFNTAYQGTDVVLSQKPAFGGSETQAGPLPESIVDQVKAVNGVAAADGQIQAAGGLVIDGKFVGATGGAPEPGAVVLAGAVQPAADQGRPLPRRAGPAHDRLRPRERQRPQGGPAGRVCRPPRAPSR